MFSESSLPPLPNGGKNNNSQSVAGGVELPPLPAADHSGHDDADEVIQNHFLRVQEAVLNSADAKIKEISSKLNQTEQLLKETNGEREEAGVALYRTRKEISHLNKILSKRYGFLALN